MKNLRLKPIFIPVDDVLVKPPSFCLKSEESYSDKLKNRTISSTDELITILHSRKAKKREKFARIQAEKDEDTVKKLSE